MLRRAGRQLLARSAIPSSCFIRLGTQSLDSASGICRSDELFRVLATSITSGWNESDTSRKLSPMWRETPATWNLVSLSQANGALWNRFRSSSISTSAKGDDPRVEIVRNGSNLNGFDCDSYQKTSRAYSSSPESEKKPSEKARRPQRLEDFQHEEIVGPTVERDMSALANEVRQALVELRDSSRKFSTFLLALGSVHLTWGVVMFLAMESPLSHAVLTQVCMSALVFGGLAYHVRQALKPIAFFMKLEERSRLRILTVSLQSTKAITSFFQRGYGIGLVLSLTLSAHLLGCVKMLFF